MALVEACMRCRLTREGICARKSRGSSGGLADADAPVKRRHTAGPQPDRTATSVWLGRHCQAATSFASRLGGPSSSGWMRSPDFGLGLQVTSRRITVAVRLYRVQGFSSGSACEASWAQQLVCGFPSACGEVEGSHSRATGEGAGPPGRINSGLD